MSNASNIIDLAAHRNAQRGHCSEQELIDDISARTFLYLRDEADAVGLPVGTVIAEHMLGMALVVEAVQGTAAARALLHAVGERLADAQ